MIKLKDNLKRSAAPPSPTLNTAAAKNLKKLSQLMASLPRPLILNLGCGQRFIGQKALSQLEEKYIVFLDLSPYPGVSLLGDAHSLPFQSASFHVIISQALLEHTQDPFLVAREMARVLKKGGYIYVETPFLQGYHGDPDDYYRFTISGLKEVLSPFIPLDVGMCGGPSSALSWHLREYLTSLITCGSQRRFLRKFFFYFWGWLTFPLKYGDLWMARKGWAKEIAAGYYFLGRKPD